MPDSLADQITRLRVESVLDRDASGAPLVPPQFVLHQGPDVHVVDLRSPSEASGVMGRIPGSVFIAPERLEAMAGSLPGDTAMVLVCRAGRQAAATAMKLEAAG